MNEKTRLEILDNGSTDVINLHVLKCESIGRFTDEFIDGFLASDFIESHLIGIGFIDPTHLDENGHLLCPFDVLVALYNDIDDGHAVMSVKFTLSKNRIH